MLFSTTILYLSISVMQQLTTGNSYEDCLSYSYEEETVNVSTLIDDLRSEFLLISADSKLLNFYYNEEYLNNDNDINDSIYAIEIERRTILYLTSFAWLFKDLNNLVWKYPDSEAKNNIYKEAINYHCHEDGSHFLFHIYDWIKLGMNDINIASSDLLLFFFSDDLTLGGRHTIYQYIYYDGVVDGQNNYIGRYIIMESLEIAGYHFFKAIQNNYIRYLKETRNNNKLRYLGMTHSNIEKGSIHSIGGEYSTDKIFGKLKINKNDYNKYKNIAKIMMKHMVNDLWENEYKFITKKKTKQSKYIGIEYN
eukprot:455872_1